MVHCDIGTSVDICERGIAMLLWQSAHTRDDCGALLTHGTLLDMVDCRVE
jgi:hypothetical protein